MIPPPPQIHEKKNYKAFTLIEISIVLVIIGLLVGGVLVGQELIRAAQLRSIVRDVEKYRTAVYTFRLKYNAIPGDMQNATSFFVGVVNGNGDGIIEGHEDMTQKYEHVSAWEHLMLADLVAGAYDGVWLNAPVAGVSFPRVNYPDATISIASRYTNDYMMVGRIHPVGTGTNLASVVTTQETFSIDSKYDDGNPVAGGILADDYAQDDFCLNGPGSGNVYNMSAQLGRNCFILFKR